MRDLGFPDWEPVGPYFKKTEGPTGPSGCGVGDYKEVLEKVAEQIEKDYGADVHLVNANIQGASAACHPSYHVRCLLIVGDLYKSRLTNQQK